MERVDIKHRIWAVNDTGWTDMRVIEAVDIAAPDL
jgi:hypothetical protein